MRTYTTFALGILLTAGTFACNEVLPDDTTSVADADQMDIRFAGQTIFYGDAPDAPYHDAVVALSVTKGGSGYICSGTFIAPDVVLTAAHCIDAANGGPNFRTVPPSDVQVRIGDDFYAPRATMAVSETLIHPGYDRRRLLNDIALLRTVGTTSLAPIPALPSASGLSSADVGATVNFAGYGQTETGALGIKLQVDNVIASIGCTIAGCPRGADPATQFAYDQAAGPCSGDSGGPAFLSRGGMTYVAGVTSYGDASCTVYGVSTRVDAYDAWITNFVGAAPFCGDGTCNGGEDCGTCAGDCGACPTCGDGVCNGDEDCSSCAGDCGDCPLCGDGTCDPSESCADCAGDCGDCPSCGLVGEVCASDADCCFEKCRGPRGGASCR